MTGLRWGPAGGLHCESSGRPWRPFILRLRDLRIESSRPGWEARRRAQLDERVGPGPARFGPGYRVAVVNREAFRSVLVSVRRGGYVPGRCK